jgi:hypothetical protein
MAAPQSADEIKGYISRNLGAPTVAVELTNDQYDDAISEAKLWFMGLIGQMKNKVLTIQPDGGAFDVADDCLSVVECHFDINRAGLFDQFSWAGVELSPYGFSGNYGGAYGSLGGGGYFDIVQSMAYLEQARRILSADRDWEWDWQAKKLRIYPTSGDIGTNVFVVYMVDEMDLSKVRPYEYRLIRKYALAEAMTILGNVRTKYADGPSATGTITLNGQDLLANADVIRDTVREQILALRPPANFFTG